MERLRYEPFGERLAPEGEAALPSRASKYLLWAGTGLFWSLVGAIVIARAVFFEPGVFDEFSRVAALVKAAIFSRAFSSEVDTGSRQENASKQESRARF